MSVAPLHKSELENVAASLHQHLTTAKYQTWSGYQMEDTYRAMALVGIANNTAFFLTYGNGDEWEDLNPLHAWLIPGNKLNHLKCTSISPSTIHKWDEYRLNTTKISDCCDRIRL